MLCPKCDRAISLDYGQDKCPHCNELVGTDTVIKKPGEGLRPPSSEPANPLVTITEDPDRPPTWDDEGPFFSRLWNTWKKSTFYPATFFKTTPTNSGLGRPLFYAIIIVFISTAAGVLWNLIFTALQIPFFGMDKKSLESIPGLYEVMPYIMMGFVILSPIFTVIWIFLWSGILHLCLMILDGNKKGFEATFRSVVYGLSPYAFGIVPFCGGIVAVIWSIVTIIIGLKQTHQIPIWKAIVAYFLPYIFCCCIAIILAIIIPTFLVGVTQGTLSK